MMTDEYLSVVEAGKLKLREPDTNAAHTVES